MLAGGHRWLLFFPLVHPSILPPPLASSPPPASAPQLVDIGGRTMTVDFYARRILPVGFFMALTLQSGNAVYAGVVEGARSGEEGKLDSRERGRFPFIFLVGVCSSYLSVGLPSDTMPEPCSPPSFSPLPPLPLQAGARQHGGRVELGRAGLRVPLRRAAV